MVTGSTKSRCSQHHEEGPGSQAGRRPRRISFSGSQPLDHAVSSVPGLRWFTPVLLGNTPSLKDSLEAVMFNSKGTAEAILAKAASQISPFLGGEGPRQEGPDKPRGGPHHHHQSPGEPGMVKARRQLSQRCRLVEPTNFWKEERWQRESLEPRECDGGCRQGRAGEVAMEWCGWSPAVAGPGAGEVGSARACARVTWWAGPARGDRGALPHGLGKKSIPAPPGVPGQTI